MHSQAKPRRSRISPRRSRRAATYLKIRRPAAMLSASAPTSMARSMRSVLVSGGRSAAATWALVKTDGILPCESIPASVGARRANPRSPSLESTERCWSGQLEEGIDCWGFSALAASVDVCGVDCPVSADAVGRASSVGCSVREFAVACWRPSSAPCCEIVFALRNDFDDAT